MQMFPIKAQYPDEEEWSDSWDDDDQDGFMRYREDLCDLGVMDSFIFPPPLPP